MQLVAQKTEAHRRIVQEMHEQEYQHALLTVKMKIRENEGADMKEMMMDQIRQWLVYSYTIIVISCMYKIKILNI